MPLFCLSCDLPGIEPASTAELPTTLTNKPNTQVKNAIFVNFVLQYGELSFPNGRNSISRYCFSQNPKCRFILFQYTNVYLCAKFGDLKPTIDEKRRPQIWACFCHSEQGAETTFHKETAIFFRLNV